MFDTTRERLAGAPQTRSWLGNLGRFLDRNDRYILPAPAVLVVLAMLVFPVGYTLYLSLHEWSGGVEPPLFVGLDNYRDMLADERFWGGIWRTVYFVVMSVGSQMVLGVIAALIFHRQFRGRNLARTFFMFPMIATPAAMVLVWKMLLDPTIGSLGYIIQKLGGPVITWTADPNLVLPTLAMVDTWEWTPLVTIIVLAGLSALPQEPFEAARVDGASGLQTFIHITLPLLRPVLVVAAMFRMIDCIKTFDIIIIISGGGPGYSSEILNVYGFNQALSYLHLGSGSALMVALTTIVVAVAFGFNMIRRRGEAK